MGEEEGAEKKWKSDTNVESNATLEKLPQEEHFSPERTEKPKKKKKANKKRKIDSNSNEELNPKRHAPHDKQIEKEKEKELPNHPRDEVAEKRKPSKDPADKPLSKKVKRDKFSLKPGRKRSLHRKVQRQLRTTRRAASRSLPRKLHVDHENEQIEVKKDVAIHQPVKVAPKRNKPLLQSKGDGAALVPVKATRSRKELQIVQEELALKSEVVTSGKRTYQEVFITRMSMRSFTSLVA
ncbi:hypothetical protein Cgig2_031337 [Carnegiea gigantea]|uniref:Uncharacterized protein n=1 Tax=Carnegiea gigantea TaxID=171969 RepID=A0A9Q1GQS1_9CARY|nr:hypothetical protein Cgig2_031337 [Carnegiea gigantea]